jgi:zinc transport system substrate-binding protein
MIDNNSGVIMKKTLYLALAVVVLMVLVTGCKTNGSGNGGKPVIVTTIYPYEMIVKQLVDTLFTVQTIIPANASPHTWSPTPGDIRKIQQADLVVSNGLGLETFLHKPLARKGTKNIAAAAFVDPSLLIYEAEHDVIEDDKEEHDAKDDDKEKHIQHPNPHVWTSPEMLFPIITGISNELSKRYPMHKAQFDNNARMMIMEINKVDSDTKLELDTYKAPAVITLHDAFIYYFRYFNIEFAGSIQEIAGKDPTPRHLKKIADMIQVKGIKTVFTEPQLNPKPVETLAKELNLKVLSYDDLGTTLGAKTIAEYLWLNWQAIKAGL